LKSRGCRAIRAVLLSNVRPFSPKLKNVKVETPSFRNGYYMVLKKANQAPLELSFALYRTL
jgi:hypothetical protein